MIVDDSRKFYKNHLNKKKLFFKSNLKLSCDRNKQINYNFLNILSEHENYSQNHKRVEVYSNQKKAKKF